MQYNSDSDNQDLVSLIGDLTNTDTTQYPIKAITRAANKANKTIWSWIFDAYGGWLYDDSNNTTDFPEATTALVSTQADYGLPATALVVRGVEVKTTGGTWQPLTAITEEQIRDRGIAEAEFMKTSAQPMYYTAYANSIKIYPPANYAQASSLRISFARGSTSFASTDTTKSPGFASEFHEAVAVGASYEFAKRKGLSNQSLLLADWQGYEKRIKEYYQSRYAELFPPRITVHDSVAEFT